MCIRDRVCADASSLSQVIVNLALNSGSYMPDGGEITITTCNGVIGPDYMKSHPEARAGDFATISVSDSGKGLDSHTLSHVFEPFYETKDCLLYTSPSPRDRTRS